MIKAKYIYAACFCLMAANICAGNKNLCAEKGRNRKPDSHSRKLRADHESSWIEKGVVQTGKELH